MNNYHQSLLRIFHVLDDFFDNLGWYPGDSEVEKVIGMILVQNTNFSNVRYSIENLRDFLSVDAILSLSLEELQVKIKPSGYYVQKSITIQNVFKLINSYGGFEYVKDINPEAFRKELISIKGIGDETADVMLLYILNSKRFISDSYARRIFSRFLGMKFNYYNDMLQISNFFIKVLSIEQLQQFHAAIDELGGNICKKRPKCSLCPLKQFCMFCNI